MKHLQAEWFWIDRWSNSRGYVLPMEARGMYREMLTQAWRRGASLPNDPEAIQRAIGATPAEWRRSWPKVRKFWRVDGDQLVNDTQVMIYRRSMELAKFYKERATKAAKGRWNGGRHNA